MSYKGSGFYNKRTGAWVSREHAIQHVGETANGWEKRRSSSTGNFYMASASGSSGQFLGMVFPELAQLQMMDAFFDMLDPTRAEAKRQLAAIADELSCMVVMEREVISLLDRRLGGHDGKLCFTKKGFQVMREISESPSLILDSTLFGIRLTGSPTSFIAEEILQFIRQQMLFGINFNPQLTLSQVNQKLNTKLAVAQEYLAKLDDEVASRTGYKAIHCLKPEAMECLNEVYARYGLPTMDRNEPYFWAPKHRETYLAGRDMPAGEYYIQAAGENWLLPSYKVVFSADNEFRTLISVDESGHYVSLKSGQELEVSNARFALARLLPTKPESSAGPGMWKVGADLKPGVYAIRTTEDYGSYSLGLLNEDVEPEVFFPEDGDEIELESGQYITLQHAEIEFVKNHRAKKLDIDLSEMSREDLKALKDHLDSMDL